MDSAEGDIADLNLLPDLDALVAGTVALMTAWADPCPHTSLPPEDWRRMVARKVVSNLFFLQHHPQVRPALRQSLAAAHGRWVRLARQDQVPQDLPRQPLEGAALH